ncbi:efflux RND transporter periplasmic adaptor subunit [Desulfobaculum bizertense]|uniref:efflux RND transporter periplasmic adaptor subunit n=1 Tax=Desulfobaculum bizertense TaxID=376490 RepID=UPI001F319E37|nr:efflux RND transporter periplasmic adaptor subunit [Desulfobaculum bizertense]UIJ38313.1 efflux RND transporter periplasmic adaptor subunit [Desulfobaculum bizertense]
MKKRPHLYGILGISAVVLLAFAAGYMLKDGPAGTEPQQVTKKQLDEHKEHGLEASTTEDGEIVWTCSMHPQIQMKEPGKCPICFMDLIPLKKKGNEGRTSLRQIKLSPEAVNLAEISIAKVQRLDLSAQPNMVGKIEYDETRVKAITAWAGGRVERLFVDYTGDTVKKGQPMVQLFSPELMTAQAELIQAIKAQRTLRNSSLDLIRKSADRTVEASREKLRLLGLGRAQIAAIERKAKPQERITIVAPQSGVVIKKNVNAGQYVKTGMDMYTIADLRRLWVFLEAYETDLLFIKKGQRLSFQTDAFPGQVYSGKVVFIDPLVNEKTRTIKVRLEVDNADLSLKPGMLVRATAGKTAQKSTVSADAPLVIPASAPLITGKRAVVYVADPKNRGSYTGREIVLGARSGSYYVVKNGLKEGEFVVTKGNFKIDSAIQIIARPSMMTGESPQLSAGKDELPPLFRSQLALLDGAFERLSQAVKSKDLSKTHLAFASFHKDLRLVDASGLQKDSKLVWDEYFMLLANDAMIGAEVPTVERLDELFTEMTAHYTRLRNEFKQVEKSATMQVPEQFRKQLTVLYGEYEAFATALAQDDTDAAKKASSQLHVLLTSIDAASLSPAARQVWSASAANMQKGLELMNSGGLVAFRAGLEPLSAGLAAAIHSFGADFDAPVYEVFCPMAFDFKGAIWLQKSTEIHNPYFGQAMQTCGEVQKQLH